MSKIKRIGERLILNVINPVFKTKRTPMRDHNGKLIKDNFGKIIKEEQDIFVKNISVPTGFDIDAIKITGGTMTQRGELSKTKCVVYDKYTSRFYTVAHSQDDVEKALDISTSYTPIGFLAHLQQNNRFSNKH